MAASLSTNDRPRRFASRRPTVDFPTPISPTSTIGRSRRFPKSITGKGYTAAHPLGKSAVMSRLVVLIIVLVLVVGGLFYLSTVPKEQPTHMIEVAVPQGGNAH